MPVALLTVLQLDRTRFYSQLCEYEQFNYHRCTVTVHIRLALSRSPPDTPVPGDIIKHLINIYVPENTHYVPVQLWE